MSHIGSLIGDQASDGISSKSFQDIIYFIPFNKECLYKESYVVSLSMNVFFYKFS